MVQNYANRTSLIYEGLLSHTELAEPRIDITCLLLH